MKALILFGVSVLLSLGIVLANPEPLPGAQNASDGNWKNPSAWDRVQYQMSERQVVDTLGTPTRRRTTAGGAGGTRLILLYQGEVEGAGYVSGNVHVSIDYDAVVDINRPVF